MKVRLLDLAHARSGDKGDTANVGVIALKPEWYPLLARELSVARVTENFRGVITGGVQRYELPNLKAINFLLHGALDGGGTLSLKTDAQGKVFSTSMLRMARPQAPEAPLGRVLMWLLWAALALPGAAVRAASAIASMILR